MRPRCEFRALLNHFGTPREKRPHRHGEQLIQRRILVVGRRPCRTADR
jgi:hypothetical protein